MEILLQVLGFLLIAMGISFMLLGSIGVLRLPDFFSRTHAASKVDTVGIVVVVTGIAALEGFTLTAGKVLLAALFILLTNPVSTHALARAALHKGIKPWRRPKTGTAQLPVDTNALDH